MKLLKSNGKLKWKKKRIGRKRERIKWEIFNELLENDIHGAPKVKAKERVKRGL